MKEKIQERQIAIKTKIKEINEGYYVIKDGWEPNYLLTKNKTKISRINLMAIVLDKEWQGETINLVLDDGSGKIVLRSFEKIKNLESINVGESILVIGKVREYNNEKYIAPEIIKKTNTKWLKVRSLELKKLTKEEQDVQEKQTEKENSHNEELIKNSEPIKINTNNKDESENETFESVNEKIIELIKKLDSGEGALIEEIKEKAEEELKEEDVEKLIDKMLKEGEIFQNLPGRIKVL